MTLTAATSHNVKPKILVIDNDSETTQAMAQTMERSGMSVIFADTGSKGMELRESFNPSVVLMGTALPDANGTDLVRWFSEQGSCGIIVMCDRAEETDRVIGLEIGADDFVTRAGTMRETVARVRAVHRRVQRAAAPSVPQPAPVVTVGPIQINVAQRTVATLEGRYLRLTAAEFNVLELLLEANGEPVTRDALSQTVLRRPWQPEDRSIDQLVFGLRQKLPAETDDTRLIHSVRGVGYLMRARDTVN